MTGNYATMYSFFFFLFGAKREERPACFQSPSQGTQTQGMQTVETRLKILSNRDGRYGCGVRTVPYNKETEKQGRG